MADLAAALVGTFIDAAVRDPAAAEALLQAHLELLNARWIHDETVLHFLAVEGFGDAVHFLAERGADVNAVNEFGDSALVDVVRLGYESIAATLLRHGANPDATSPIEENVLHLAVAKGHAGIVRMLFQAGVQWDYRTEYGDTLWDAVAESVDPDDVVAVLAEFGVTRSDE
jgi:ankyrin repeat protein